jgi:hypothetical protein
MDVDLVELVRLEDFPALLSLDVSHHLFGNEIRQHSKRVSTVWYQILRDTPNRRSFSCLWFSLWVLYCDTDTNVQV